MNTDIRLSVNFFNHIKTLQLRRRCGEEGVLCLLKLWVWAAVNRPSGDLSGFCSGDLESFSGWNGESGCFAEALREVGWLDGDGDGNGKGKENSFRLHGWEEFQTWATGATRREDVGRMNILARKNRSAYERLKAENRKGISREEYVKLIKPGWEEALNDILKYASSTASTPTPTPTPYPNPYPSPKRKKGETKNQKDQSFNKPDFERQWEGEPFQKASPLDYIRKIQEIASNAPVLEPRKPGSRGAGGREKSPALNSESEEKHNGEHEEAEHDGRGVVGQGD